MGCANVFQKKIVKSKDIDLNFQVIKPNFKDTNDSSLFKKKVIGENFDENTTFVKNEQDITIDKKIKNEEKEEKEEKVEKVENVTNNNKNKKDSIGSGPIINLLKRQVKNFKKTEKKI